MVDALISYLGGIILAAIVTGALFLPRLGRPGRYQGQALPDHTQTHAEQERCPDGLCIPSRSQTITGSEPTFVAHQHQQRTHPLPLGRELHHEAADRYIQEFYARQEEQE